MEERALFTTLWENESKTTRKVIARIPKGSTTVPSEVSHRERNRVADCLRREDDHRGRRDR